MQKITATYRQCRDWVCQPRHKQKAQELTSEVNRAFTEHPGDTGETYWQHLWFTCRMAGRLIYTTTVLMIHGLFPFLLDRAASKEIEHMYGIIKKRIPKSRRDEIDLDYSV